MTGLSMGGIMRELDLLKRSECSCEFCISLCRKTPGWFRPREIPRLAKFFGLTVREVFEKYLIVDIKPTMNGRDIYVLTPVKNFELVDEPVILMLINDMRDRNKLMGWNCDRAGAWTSVKYTWIGAPCIFYENKKCKIHSVKPFECSITRHDIKHDEIRVLLAEEWRNSKLVKGLLKGQGPIERGEDE